MRIAIIGAGWFGCHLGMALRREFDVTIFEKESDVFQGASGANQNRLHQGFHYPRSAATRDYAQLGYQQFLDAYGFLCESIEHNLYAIAKHVSLMDFRTYLAVMDSQNLEYKVVRASDYGLTNVEGCICCPEMLIRNDKAAEWFFEQLGGVLVLNHEFMYDDMGDFDVTINCSSQCFAPHPEWNLVYEPCVMLDYALIGEWADSGPRAVTIMDGPLCTIYPKWDGLYTVYSVEHSSLGQCESVDEVNRLFDEHPIQQGRFETLVDRYMPWFRYIFAYAGERRSVRVTFGDAARSRVPHVKQTGGIIQVLPCKIDNIFEAEREVRRLLHRGVEL